MKRIGYIGLSSPIFYDYATTATRAPSDIHSSPNPILEGAFGSMLLYDELWFLCRSLCPENMRQLSYVKFLDEIGLVKDIAFNVVPPPEAVFSKDALARYSNSSSRYSEMVRKSRFYWDHRVDNHTHTLDVCGFRLNGNSWNARAAVIDLMVVELIEHEVELITNSFTAALFQNEVSERNRIEIAQQLVLDTVPQFLSETGPYHPCLEEVRDSNYLHDFRRWMRREFSTAGERELAEIKDEIDTKIADSKRDVFLKHLDRRGTYATLAHSLLGIGADSLIPGISNIKGLAGLYTAERKKESIRWQGFLIE